MITQLRRDYSKEKYCNPRSEQHQTSMVTNSLPHSLTHLFLTRAEMCNFDVERVTFVVLLTVIVFIIIL